MFHQAVQKAQQADVAKKPLSKQLFPSSSPPAIQSSITQFQKPARPLSNVSTNVLRSNLPQDTMKPYRANSGGKPNVGVKRTAGGLEKIVNTNDGFEDVSHPKFQTKALTIHDSPVKSSNDVFFDDDDFDSDIDLDVEDPATKGVVTYPKLPPIQPMSKPTFQPTLPRQASHVGIQGTFDSGYGSAMQPKSPHLPKSSLPPNSSVPVPWSSSPPEHHAAPPSRVSLAQFAYGATEEKPRPTKRRTMPWLQKQAEVAAANDESLPEPPAAPMSPEKHKPKRLKSNGPKEAFTPLPKDNKKSMFPWNITASTIKQQQKEMREANKRLTKTHEAKDDGLLATVAKRKGVAKPFLSEEQQHVLDLVVENKKSVFFTGSAGTGKSVLLREIISALKKKYHRETDRVAVTASTGLAACNVGGVTLHSFAGFGLGKEPVPELVKKIKRNTKSKHRWMRTKVLIVDEISMVDGDFFDKLEEIARIIRNNGRPFGGIQLVITGDFFQLPPVPDYGKIAKFAFDAATWNTSIEHTIALHHVFRQKDPVFAGMLNEMREGRLSQQSIQAFRKLSRPIDGGDDLEATELFPTRNEVDGANGRRMQMLVGEVKIYEARDGGAITDKAQRDKLLQNCMAPDIINLKKGAQVMLIKNIDDTLVNGSLGKVIGFMSEAMFDSYEQNEEAFYSIQSTEDNELNPSEKKLKTKIDSLLGSTAQVYPVVRFAIADGTTRDLLCQRETWKIELPNGEVQASRSQVPLILAWALSIHKAQGQTLERVKVDLGKVFEKGQAYVALSRAVSMQGLQVLRFEPGKVMAHEKVRSFYANLSRVEHLKDDGAAKKKRKGVSAADYERGFVDDEEAMYG